MCLPGYVLATGLILWSSVSDLGNSTGVNVLYILEWQAIGVLYLEVARLVNDKLLLSTRECSRAARVHTGPRRVVTTTTFGGEQGTFAPKECLRQVSTTMLRW